MEDDLKPVTLNPRAATFNEVWEAGHHPQQQKKSDPVNHPPHYTQRSGVECIDVTEHMSFNAGNAMKYLWRYEDKGSPIQDLKKAAWYLDREIKRLEE